jgi:Protein of unknown function (DUF1573)
LVGFFFIVSDTKRDTTEPDRSEIFVPAENTIINQVPTYAEPVSVEVGTSYESSNRTILPTSEPVYQAESNTQTYRQDEPVYQNTVIAIEAPNQNTISTESIETAPVSYNSTDPEPSESSDEGTGYNNPADAKLKFNRTVFNFGTIKDGAEASTLFVFTNIGDEPLEIEVVSACFCMTVNHTRDLINKGEKGNIDVVFDSNDQVGSVKKDIDIIFKNIDKDGYPLIKRLTIKGRVLPK